MKITQKSIGHLKYDGKRTNGGGASRCVYWDGEIRGFGVRVFPTGRKTFILSYRAKGRKRLMTLGSFGIITLSEARDKARKFLGRVIEGEDPLLDRKKAGQGETIKSLCGMYIERHARPHKKTWKTDQARINRYILPAWGSVLVKALTRNDVAVLHHRIGKKKQYESNRVLSLIGKIFTLARQWGFVEENHVNPARDITNFKESKRDRWVTPEELPKLAEAIDGVENIYCRAVLWLYLFVGCRKQELLKAKWEHIDFERKKLKLPNTKSGSVHYVPLSRAAMSILENLPQTHGNPYIFCGKFPGKPLANIDRTWRKVRKEAGIEDVRLHDLRRTLASWMVQAGNDIYLVGRVLGHSHLRTTETYAHFGEDHIRNALEDHGDKLMLVAGKQPEGEVVDLKKGRGG